MKRISKQEARDKYGVIVTGVNSLYDYYLTDDGKVIDSGGDVRYTPPTAYEKHKQAARQAAIEWQHETSETALSYSELAAASAHFEKLARRFGLVREFRENAII